VVLMGWNGLFWGWVGRSDQAGVVDGSRL
jgi:hypothetical protein